MEELIARTFSLRNAVHLAHWSTRSFAEHEALGEFYVDIIDKIDLIIEAYQGVFGLVGQVASLASRSNAVVDEIRSELEWLMENREELSKGNAVLLNQIDDLGHFYAQTIYKLDFLS